MSDRRLPALLASVAVSLVGSIVLASCGGGDAPTLSPEAAQGRSIASANGCAGCHGADGKGGAGPAWVGLAGSQVELDSGDVVIADDAYLSRAITDPRAEVVAGWTLKMPDNDLSDDEVASVVAYIEELR